MITRILFSSVVLLLAMTGAAFSQPKRVLIVHSVGRDFSPWDDYARKIREELNLQSKDPIDIFEASLSTARFPDGNEGAFVSYLNAVFSERKLDLIMTIGGPAARFFQQNRQRIFPSIPTLYAAVAQQMSSNAPATDAMVSVSVDILSTPDQILKLVETTKVFIVMGSSPIEKLWLEEMRKLFQPLTSRLEITYSNELSLEQILEQVAILPPRTFIVYGQMLVDAAGVVHEGNRAIDRIHAVANAPIFSEQDAFFGRGIIGGRMTNISDVSRQTAAVAVRILGGESPGSIKTPPIRAASPRYDWRELKRWNISESQLPPGSEVMFRVPTVWEQYRPQLTAVTAAILLQAGIIALLLVERRRRRVAQAEANSRRQEVVRLNRVTTASVLSSSIAHELNQPLGAILSNTEAAQVLLKANPPDVAQLGEILSDIVRDEQRASDIIGGLRNLLNNRTESDLRTFDLNESVRDIVKIVSPEITRRGVNLRTILTPEPLRVRCDPIHLQQVLMNLVMNGVDAMDNVVPRNLSIRTALADADGIEVQISDSGTGIPNNKLASIFNAFVTTKPEGTGLGLPIARTILESYGGELWAENRTRGAVFSFRLPLDRSVEI
ncbi:His Kinase A (phospho-acceptor) domain-containing protein [Bradyrhizobium lablabi]|uniref:histidine kinase n=3 Tax=Nitrobacteraceae TaxID=41294 RepID=A0ABY0QFU7_9BRAD|nr:His Kinase A (phospho-acceptor) domain-containing protein [Bradyrhizobium ottawaense]SEE45947.1 His Kinase A (phospho-acceptor) domain-containing protein [Bradyrhizobium lablabi]